MLKPVRMLNYHEASNQSDIPRQKLHRDISCRYICEDITWDIINRSYSIADKTTVFIDNAISEFLADNIKHD